MVFASRIGDDSQEEEAHDNMCMNPILGTTIKDEDKLYKGLIP